jgi:hypothetical protein
MSIYTGSRRFGKASFGQASGPGMAVSAIMFPRPILFRSVWAARSVACGRVFAVRLSAVVP